MEFKFILEYAGKRIGKENRERGKGKGERGGDYITTNFSVQRLHKRFTTWQVRTACGTASRLRLSRQLFAAGSRSMAISLERNLNFAVIIIFQGVVATHACIAIAAKMRECNAAKMRECNAAKMRGSNAVFCTSQFAARKSGSRPLCKALTNIPHSITQPCRTTPTTMSSSWWRGSSGLGRPKLTAQSRPPSARYSRMRFWNSN